MTLHLRKWATLIPVVALFCILAGNSAISAEPGPDRVQQWREDLRYLADKLPKVHYNAFHSISKTEFNEAVSRLDAAIPQLQDNQIIVELARLVAKVGDAHTAVSLFQPGFQFRVFPIGMTWFNDGIFVTAAPAQYRQIVGARLVKVGQADVNVACAEIGRIISHENEAYLKNVVPTYMIMAEVLHSLGLVSTSDRATFEFIDASGKPITVEAASIPRSEKVDLVQLPDYRQIPLPLYLKNQRQYYWYEYLPQHKAVYFQYNACREMASSTLGEFTRQLLDFVDQNPVERIIVDLRFNGGGNSALLQPLIKGLQKREKINSPGHLFVIIGRKTFSSAILNALEFQSSTHAILVGEPTGGRPNHYGEVQTITLPNSKLVISYSTKYFRDSKNDTPSLMPDIMAEPSSSAFFAGRDTALEAVLGYPSN